MFPLPSPSILWHVAFKEFGNKLLDRLAFTFALPVPPNVNQDVGHHRVNHRHDYLTDTIVLFLDRKYKQ